MPAHITISISKQSLNLTDDSGFTHSYPISSAANGIGSEEGSYRTPLGNFIICEKHGCNAPSRTMFKGRKPIGEYDPTCSETDHTHDHVLTRILWLHGTDGDNANTKERYIYIHGTNQEHLIGTPASHGCIRMRNADIIHLYDQVEPGTTVQISL